jgi:hypothetical protein
MSLLEVKDGLSKQSRRKSNFDYVKGALLGLENAGISRFQGRLAG